MVPFYLQLTLFSPIVCSGFYFARPSRLSQLQMAKSGQNLRPGSITDLVEIKYDSVVLSGFSSKELDIAEPYVFMNLHEKDKFKSITAVTDDMKYARKRMITRDTVYSGLADLLEFALVSNVDAYNELKSTLNGKDAWISFNITSAEVPKMAELAVSAGLKRVVFGVRLTPEEEEVGNTYNETTEKLINAGINYTIVNFGQNVEKESEARYPYRIRLGSLPLPKPTVGHYLCSGDLLRVIAESVDFLKSFNTVYGIGPGTFVDSEIMCYMKGMGWPERVQVGIALGDTFDEFDRKYKISRAAVDAKDLALAKSRAAGNELPKQSKVSNTGFFS